MRRECPGCAIEIESGQQVCPICGYEFPRTRPLIVGAAVAVLVAILLPLILRLARYLSG
jgi:hypothetical protein